MFLRKYIAEDRSKVNIITNYKKITESDDDESDEEEEIIVDEKKPKIQDGWDKWKIDEKNRNLKIREENNNK